MKCLLLLLITTICLLFCVSGNTDIKFGGFIPNAVYTYYTNGFNTITQLTCTATSNTYTIINTTWIDLTDNTDTGSSVLRFEDIATEVTWGYHRDYLCRAFYQTDLVMYQDSDNITVEIKYNTTITVSYGDITHIKHTTHSYEYIPVMTENVVISCDANMTKWNSNPTGISQQTDVANPVMIDLFTIQYATDYFSTNVGINNWRVIVSSVTLKAYGSGIYKQQQQDTYTQLTEGESVYITEDTTLVCVSSRAGYSAWYYTNISTGVEERITDGTDVIDYKGFLTLSLQTTSRAGYYICKTLEVIDSTVTGMIVHSITVSVHIVTTTTILTGPILNSPITTETVTTPKTTTAGASIQQTFKSTLQHNITQTTTITTITTTTTTTTNNNTDTILEDTSPYPFIGLVAVVLVILILVIIVVILVIVFIVKRRKTNKPGYTKQLQTNNIEDTTTDVNNNNNNNREYVNLQDLSNKPVPPPNTRKPVYRKLVQTDTPVSSPVMSPPEDTDGYMTLEQLEGSIGAGGKSDPCVEENIVPNYESQYENVKMSLYESTTAKYSRDPCATLVPLSQFKNHLSHLLIESRLEKEYSQLGEQDLRYECTHALRSENSGRNKYKLIYPYDKSRVILTSNKESDYINATYIPGFYVSDTFIVAQAPKKNTETHFWQMILEQRVSKIVMLTRVMELGKEKCTSYWPQQVGSSSNFEGIKVTLKREEISLRYVLREMEITGPDSSSYKLTQFHYMAWPDHDVPQLFMELLEFTQMIKKRHMRERTPLLVHCSAGVGRSGTFIALYNLLEAVGVEETISVYRIVNEMREYRPQMVQTLNQYKFIYLAVLEMIFGMTGVSSKDFCDTYKLYLQSHGEIGDVFRQQFEELCYQSDCSFTYPQEAARDPSNLAKNAIKEVLPYDTNRVILYSPNWSCEYINASYMGSYEMIVTMLPTQETIQDFLQLVYQLEDPLVVLLFTQIEYQNVRSGVSKRVCYWLEESGNKQFGEFSATTEKSQKTSSLIQQKMKVYSNYENYEKQFSQFISLVWEDTGAVNDVLGVLTLLELIMKLMITTPGKKIVFCCNDGIGKSGVLTTLYRAVREVGECIDVFQTVKQIRSYRKDMVPTLEHYMSCYHLINEYCQMNL